MTGIASPVAATMACKHRPLDHDEACAQITKPIFAVRAVPDCPGGLRVCDLVRTETTDITVKQPARLQLLAHVTPRWPTCPCSDSCGPPTCRPTSPPAPDDYLRRTPRFRETNMG